MARKLKQASIGKFVLDACLVACLFVCAQPTNSAPVSPNDQPYRVQNPNTWATLSSINGHLSTIRPQLSGAQTSSRPLIHDNNESMTPSTSFASSDYVISDSEYQLLLERLRREFEESVASNPGNYVNSDVDIEEVIRMIERQSSSSTELSRTTTTTTTTATTATTSAALELESQTISGVVEQQAGAAEGALLGDANHRQQVSDGLRELEEKDVCVICLDDFESGDVRYLECLHKFHALCINDWIGSLRQNFPYVGINCPLCRKSFYPDTN